MMNFDSFPQRLVAVLPMSCRDEDRDHLFRTWVFLRLTSMLIQAFHMKVNGDFRSEVALYKHYYRGNRNWYFKKWSYHYYRHQHSFYQISYLWLDIWAGLCSIITFISREYVLDIWAERKMPESRNVPTTFPFELDTVPRGLGLKINWTINFHVAIVGEGFPYLKLGAISIISQPLVIIATTKPVTLYHLQ